jgi:hypothetical protein
MKTAFFSKSALAGAFWAGLFLTLFSAPVIMAARVADEDRTAELIRQHMEILSPWPSASAALPQGGACEQGAEAPMEQETSMEAEVQPEAPVIRSVDRRNPRIEV